MNNKKIVLVTGSSRGIGLAVAEKFSNHGWFVIQNSRNKLSQDSFQGNAFLRGDITKLDDVTSLVHHIKEEFGTIDALICNVGIGQNQDFGDIQERWNHFLTMNLYSATTIIELLLPILNNSSVTVISSICGSSVIETAPVEYSVAKAALNQYVRVMAKKYAKERIRFNSISPGNVLFDGSLWQEKLRLNEKDTVEYIKRNVPLGEFIEPQDIAEMAFYLSSNNSRYITGQNIIIDGGQSL